MEKATSIHFAKTSSFSFFHNDRSKSPSYIIRDSQDNEIDKTAEEATRELTQLYISAKSNYMTKTKQKFQAKNYLIEAVIVIEDKHTLEDIRAVANMVEEKTGYRPIQLSIHRDEGKDKEHINNHAHIVFFTLDENGKSLQRQNFNNKNLMKELQTQTAQILQMKRGVSKEITKAEHLNHRQYKSAIKSAEKHIKAELEKWNNRLKEQLINILESTSKSIKKFFMTEQINQIELENTQLKQTLTDTKRQITQEIEKSRMITNEAENYKEQLISEKSKNITPRQESTIQTEQQPKQARRQTL